ncbi:MAG TPA: PQQ-binding-like beta-propeller repeat protein [Planctomycetaceae bacterium]|nr:PQQ-binding-like beta-propeller repeat protein [Planctomycetaceae bacterium]
MDRTTVRLAAPAGILTVAFFAAIGSAGAQPVDGIRIGPDGRVAGGTDDAPDGRRLFVTDRELSQRMREATELLTAQKYAAAIARLQFLLDRPEDVFFQPDPEDASHFLSLKAEVQRRIAELPAEGRRLYEAQYAEPARQMLEDGVAAGDVKRLEEVVRRYFHTAAGYEAMYLVATSHLDRGEPLAAALHFDRLRKVPQAARRWEPLLSLKAAVGWGRAGLPAEAVRTLVALKAAAGDNDLTLGGRSVAFFRTEDEALPWLVRILEHDRQFSALGSEDWTMFRGNTARNAGATQAAPLWQITWTAATTVPDDPGDTPSERFQEAAMELKQLEDRFRRSGSFLTIPAAGPIVAGNAVVFRTPRNVRAVDLESGGVLWESFDADEAFYEIIENRMQVPAPRNNPFGIPQLPPRETLLAQRAWRDLTHGTISSDGRYAFSLEKLSFLGPFQNYGRGMTNHPLMPTNENKLVAYELRSGKMSWQVDGSRRDADAIAPGAFFLGPPMPLGDQLYCLVESGGEIRLLVLEVDGSAPDDDGQRRPPEPRTVWEQRLIYPQQDVGQNPLRRLAGMSPAYDDGIVVCPTMAGAVVAVDVSRRMLLWGYHYETEQPAVAGNRQAMLMAQLRRSGYGVFEFDDDERWVDSVPVIADGHVLLTPRDSNELHCLSLVDGTVRWKKPRGQGLSIACVYRGSAVIAGRTHLEAWRLSDGEAVWKAAAPTGMPSGRGVRIDDRYHVPVETGEIVTVELTDGRIVGRSKAPGGQPAGNLVAARGRLIWQTIDSVVALESADTVAERVAEALAKNPDDAGMLALRGELRLHRGDEQGGLADLKTAARLDPMGRAREVLAATFMELLRNDFAKYRGDVEEIEQLVGDPKLRLEYLRMHADGLYELGERGAAFDAYLKLADLEAGLPERDERSASVKVDASLSVRADRWVGSRLRELFASAEGDDRNHMTAALEARIKTALESESVGVLRNLTRMLGDLPSAHAARQKLVERLDTEQQAVEIAIELDRLRASGRSELAAYATARLVELLASHGRPGDAHLLLDEVQSKWADVVCIDALTGRELLEKWKSHDALASHLERPHAWGQEAFRVSTGTTRIANAEMKFPVDLVEPSGPYAGRRLLVDQRRRFLSAHDTDGRELWKLTLAGSNPNGTVFFTGGYARALGHVLFVALDEDLLVLDALTAGGTPKVLWKRRLFDERLESPNDQNAARIFLGGNVAVVAGGRVQQQMTDRYGRPMGRLGPVSHEVICYQVGSRVVAAEPLTGRTLWEREYIERGSELLGDGGHLVIVQPGERQAIVLRMSDGREVARPELPAGSDLQSTLGASMVTWSRDGDGFLLRRHDAVTGRTVWEARFADGARLDLARNEFAGVLEPDGRFRLLSLADGEVLIDDQLAADPGVASIHLRRSLDRWLLLTYNPAREAAAPQGNVRVMAAAAAFGQAMVNGAVHAFDVETGRQAWTCPLGRLYGLDLSQPEQSPVLALASGPQQVVPPAAVRRAGNLFAQAQYSLALIDTRTGEMIHEETGPLQSAPFEVVLDPAERRIEILSSRLRVVLRQGAAAPGETMDP